jgi:hypothetical protein
VQLTFHENEKKVIGGANCVMLEPDMDYYPRPRSPCDSRSDSRRPDPLTDRPGGGLRGSLNCGAKRRCTGICTALHFDVKFRFSRCSISKF